MLEFIKRLFKISHPLPLAAKNGCDNDFVDIVSGHPKCTTCGHFKMYHPYHFLIYV